jgi:hypothetical protein
MKRAKNPLKNLDRRWKRGQPQPSAYTQALTLGDAEMRHKTITTRAAGALYRFAQDSGIVTLPVLLGAALLEVLL